MITGNNLHLASAKRTKNERAGIHEWHPYYAGFSEAFVRDILDFFRAKPGSLVLDPWIGSGTTSVVCQKKSIQCYGIEINPVMVDFAKAKCANLLDLNIKQYIECYTEKANDIKYESNCFSQTGNFLKQKHKLQLSTLFSLIQRKFEIADIIEAEYIESFLRAALYRTIRRVGYIKNGSNPTWLSKQEHNPEEDDDIDAVREYKIIVNSMLKDLEKAFSPTLNSNTPLSKIYIGNSKQLPFDTNKFDFIISSPLT